MVIYDTIETYLNLEEDSFKMPSDDEDPVDPCLIEAQKKYNALQERYIALKTMAGTLKVKISIEKELLDKELKAVAEAEAQMRAKAKNACGDIVSRGDDFKEKVELFKDYIISKQATESFQSILRKRNYQSSLLEVENKCNLELLKIKESLMMLKPLKEIVSGWSEKGTDEKITESCGASDSFHDESASTSDADKDEMDTEN